MPNKHIFFLFLTAAMLSFSLPAVSTAANTESTIKPPLSNGLYISDPRITKNDIEAIYQNHPEPLWFYTDGEPRGSLESLLPFLVQSAAHGLTPSDYDIKTIARFLDDPHDHTWSVIEKDVLVTQSALRYIADMRSGRPVPEEIDIALVYTPEKENYAKLLLSGAKHEYSPSFWRSLEPPQSEYQMLKQTYQKLRERKGETYIPIPSSGPLIKAGQKDARIPQIRKRLEQEGYLDSHAKSQQSQQYSSEMVAALQLFQEEQGLKTDGIIGPETLHALNMPVQAKMDKLVMAMEKWRWLPDDLGPRHIRVNIAGFYARAFDNNQKVLDMPVIVGKEYKQTPVFSSQMNEVVFQPYWWVPPSLSIDYVIKHLKEEPDFLERNNITLLRKGQPVNIPPNMAWDSFTEKDFHTYTFRQAPGPRNALGRVKFNLDNPMMIYMHDTPKKHLFNNSQRAFSSGCIRLGDPLQMAYFALDNKKGWTDTDIKQAYYGKHPRMEADRPYAVSLDQPVPIYIMYWTAWVKDDHVHYSPDIYEQDQKLAAAYQQMRMEKQKLASNKL